MPRFGGSLAPTGLIVWTGLLLGLPLYLVFATLWTDYRPELGADGWKAAWPFLIQTLIYAVASTVGQMIVGVAAALAVLWTTRSVMWRTVVIAVLLLPYAIPASVVGLAFGFAAGPQSAWAGLMEDMFRIPTTTWLYAHALATAVLASVWQYFPFAFLLTFLALRAIPEVTLRAAQLDGAPFLSITFRIALGSVWPVLLAIATLRFVFMLVKFDTPFVFMQKIASPDSVATLELWRSVGGSTSPHLGTIAWTLQLGAIVIGLFYAFLQRRGVA